uniref:C2H2-type domain-containing protein n=1 Tax=Globodera rostochiensis TaxID=31243 RepID=A0A914H1M2_GLORO
MLNCQLCIDENGDGVQDAMKFSSLEQLEAHLAADHFSVLPYECEQCQFAKFPTEFAVMKHNEMDHDNQSYSFRCRITPDVKAKRQKVRECLLNVTDEKFPSNLHTNFNEGKLKEMLSSKTEARMKRSVKNGQNRTKDRHTINGGESSLEEQKNDRRGRLRRVSCGDNLEIVRGLEQRDASLSTEGEEADDAMEGQQADVQEILKATAAAVSQIGGSKKQLSLNSPVSLRSEAYSLRPNRFKPLLVVLGKWKAHHRPKEMVNARGGCLSHHTNARHLRLPMFQCALCKKDFFEVSNTQIQKHMSTHHKGEKKHLISNYHKFSAILHATRDECFGKKDERIRTLKSKVGRTPNVKGRAKSVIGMNGIGKRGEGIGEEDAVESGHSKSANDGAPNCLADGIDGQLKGGAEENDGSMPSIDKYSYLKSWAVRLSAEHQRPNQHPQQEASDGPDQRVSCKVCGEMVWNKTGNRLNHVNVRHLQLPLHECDICQKTFTSYSRSACYSHVQFAHKAQIGSGQGSNVIEKHIIYRKELHDVQLLEAAKEHF